MAVGNRCVIDCMLTIMYGLCGGCWKGASWESIYNIGADCPQTNLYLVNTICAHLNHLRPASAPAGVYTSLIRHVADCPGHDGHYALDSSKMQALGGRPEVPFEQGLQETISFLRY